MSWSGHYINLDRATARREALEAHLARLGLADRYQRFPAIDGKVQKATAGLSAAEVAIFASHLALLRIAAAATTPTHIVEDDVLISRACAPFIGSLARLGVLDRMDMVVTDTGMALDGETYRAFRALSARPAPGGQRQVEVLDITSAYRWGLTSYIVSPAGARKLLAEAEAEWSRGPQLAIDRLVEQAAKAGRITIGCTFPLLTWLDFAHARNSMAARPWEAPIARMVQQLLRYPFYAEADVTGFLLPMLRDIVQAGGEVDAQQLPEVTRRALHAARIVLKDWQ